MITGLWGQVPSDDHQLASPLSYKLILYDESKDKSLVEMVSIVIRNLSEHIK